MVLRSMKTLYRLPAVKRRLAYHDELDARTDQEATTVRCNSEQAAFQRCMPARWLLSPGITTGYLQRPDTHHGECVVSVILNRQGGASSFVSYDHRFNRTLTADERLFNAARLLTRPANARYV
jgi:hypothetical protein